MKYLAWITKNIGYNIYGFYLQTIRYSIFNINTDSYSLNEKKLKRFLQNASKKSKFWRTKFRDYQVDIYSTDIRAELSKLPALRKKEVIENYKDIITRSLPFYLSKRTSGTSGASLKVITSIRAEAFQWQVWRRYWRSIGIQDDCQMAWFGGRKILEKHEEYKPWLHVYSMNRIMVSSHSLTQHNVVEVKEYLEKNKISWIHGYPSSVAYFCELLFNAGLEYNMENVIVTVGGESLLNSQVYIIKKILKSVPYQHFGLTEGTINISQSRDYKWRFDEDFALVIREGNTLLGTNYNNPNFPLINYDSEDFFDFEGKTLTNILGRVDDYVIDDKGIRHSRLDHLFKDVNGIVNTQIVQRKAGYIIIYVVANRDLNLSRLESKVREYFRKNMNFKIELVERIQRNNKHKQVVRYDF